MLGHVFGATALAISTTLSVFMGGLALGSHLGGKWATRLKRPLLAFAVLETAVGLFGLLVPTLLDLMGPLQAYLALDFGDGIWGYALLRFLLVALVLIIPTTAMGATLPILAEGVVKSSGHLASKTGQLYAANTFGAVVGSFVAGFVLIPELGITATVYLAAGIDLLVAVVVVGLWRLAEGDGILVRRRGEPTADELLLAVEPLPTNPISPIQRKTALVVFALSGAAAMALEVLWSRAIGVTIGASTYSFTLILTTFLVGLAVGAYVVSRRVDQIVDPVRWLAWTEVAVGTLAIVASMFIDRLPLWVHATAVTHGVTMGHIYVTNFLIIAAVTLPSTLALGAVMPLVVRILAPEGTAHAGPIVGKAYALNTVGAIAGSFAAGFIILPTIGVERGLSLAAAISIMLGVVLAVSLVGERKNLMVAASLGGLLILFGPKWDVRSWTSGLFRMYLARSVYADGWSPSGKVLYHRDGIATSVTVDETEGSGSISLKVNGKVDASDVGDMPTQVLSGLLPILLHPDPKDALVIGYGSGVTPGAVLQAPVERLDVAEIEEAVYEASNRFFAHVNHEPAKDPRTRLVVDDGRNFLLTRDVVYDVIISEPSNPWMTGAASLFTVDFFEIAKSHLREEGVFLQWLQLYELSPENINALLRTFSSVFEHVIVFTPDPRSNDTLLIGTRKKIRVMRDRLTTRLEDPKIAAELERANVRSVHDFFGLFLLGEEELPRFVGEGPLNTDDNALIEFSAPKDLLVFAMKDPRLPFLEGIAGKRLELTPKYFEGFSFDAEMLFAAGVRLLEQGQLEDAKAFLIAAKEEGADVERMERIIEYIEQDDDQPVVMATEETKEDERYARSAWAMMNGKDRDALVLFEMEEGLEDVSLAHRFLYAFLCYRNDRLFDAEYLLKDILADEEFVARVPMVLYYAGRIALYRSKWEDAVGYLGRFDDATASERIEARAE